MRSLVFLICSFLVIPSVCAAQFRSNYQDWNELAPDLKIGYVMGAMDQLLARDEPYFQDVGRCVIDLDLRVGNLVEIVDRGYQDLNNWEHPPTLILLFGIGQVCESSIARYRSDRGE